jgi:N-methylhydantoinase A
LKAHEVKKNSPKTDNTREVWFDGKAFIAMVFERENLAAGAMFVGPAIIEQFDSTTVIPPATTAEVDTYMNIIIRVQE